MNHPLYRPRPSVTQLWRGCILCTIAEGLYSALAGVGGIGGSSRWWENGHYLLDNGSGDLGALAFSEGQVVGVFFDHESSRSPWSQERDVHGVEWYFRGMSSQLRAWADREVLPYTVRWGSREKLPLITAAFWGENDVIAAVDPWPDLFWHGATILYAELQDPESAIRTLTSELGLPAAYVELLRSLYQRRVAAYNQTLTVTEGERRLLVENRPPEEVAGQEWRLTGGDDDAGITLCREMLAPIGIIVP